MTNPQNSTPETDLPALCVRVWGKVPAAIPYDVEDYLTPMRADRPDREHIWYIPGRLGTISDDIAVAMIQAACLRWLLENVAAVETAKDGEAYFVDIYRRDGDWTISIANISGPCLTTCLLLAVERCHEYKNKENK